MRSPDGVHVCSIILGHLGTKEERQLMSSLQVCDKKGPIWYI